MVDERLHDKTKLSVYLLLLRLSPIILEKPMRIIHQNLTFDARFVALVKERFKAGTFLYSLMTFFEGLLKNKFISAIQLISESFIALILFLPVPFLSTFIKSFAIGCKGVFGYYLRSLLFRQKCAFVGANVLISRGVEIRNLAQMEIGNFAYLDQGVTIMCPASIGQHCHIAFGVFVSGGGSLKVEDYASIGMRSIVLTSTDTAGRGFRATGPMVPAAERKVIRKETIFRRDSFTGPLALIFPGVVMAEGSVLSGGSVMRRNAREWTVYHGNPARAISIRKEVL